MARVSPENKWDNYSSRPIKDAIRALFANFDHVYSLLNKDAPELTPDIVAKSGLEEQDFMMGDF